MPSSALLIRDDLPYVDVEIICHGQSLSIGSVLIDTGSGSTCFEADLLRPLGLLPDPDAVLQLVHGVGGCESVYSATLDSISIGDLSVSHVSIDVGRMGYGFGINGILGMDFLVRVGAVIDLPSQEIRFVPRK